MNIIRNSIKTPDGTVLVSRHQHDYVSHVDKNGETYMIDGGLSYFRGSINKEKATPLHVTTNDSHEEVSKALIWGTYGKNSDQPLHFISLCDMDTEHIRAVLNECILHKWRREIMEHELKLRGEKV